MRQGVGLPDSLIPFPRSRRKSRLMASNRWTSKSRLGLALIYGSFQGSTPISGRYSRYSVGTLHTRIRSPPPRRRERAPFRGRGIIGAPHPARSSTFLSRRVKPQLAPTAPLRVLVAVRGGIGNNGVACRRGAPLPQIVVPRPRALEHCPGRDGARAALEARAVGVAAQDMQRVELAQQAVVHVSPVA